jgi:hypothetical protein
MQGMRAVTRHSAVGGCGLIEGCQNVWATAAW